MKIQLFRSLTVLLLCLSLCACSSKNVKRIALPEADDLASIQVVINEQTETHTDLTWIETAPKELSSAVDTGKESVQDVPGVEAYYEVRLEYYGEKYSVVYIYEQNGEFYVEQPYEGIWKIEENQYSFLTDTEEN